MIYLIGFPGTGKYTIAKEICKQADVKLVDNHLINNPVFNLIAQDGKTPLPEEVWTYARKIRQTVLDVMSNISPAEYNFVLTNNLHDEDAEDTDIFNKIKATAKKRQATFVPIRLMIDVEENKKRITTPSRAAMLKETNPETPAKNNAQFTILKTGHTNELTLDVTNLSAQVAATKIINHAKTRG